MKLFKKESEYIQVFNFNTQLINKEEAILFYAKNDLDYFNKLIDSVIKTRLEFEEETIIYCQYGLNEEKEIVGIYYDLLKQDISKLYRIIDLIIENIDKIKAIEERNRSKFEKDTEKAEELLKEFFEGEI